MNFMNFLSTDPVPTVSRQKIPNSPVGFYLEGHLDAGGRVENLSILYVVPRTAGDGGLLPLLDTLAAHVQVAADLAEALRLLDEREFQVGLVRCGPLEDLNFYDGIEDLVHHCRGSAMAWVALACPEALGNETVRRLIAESFHDYHTLPVDLDRLRATLGHAAGMADIRREAGSIRPHPVGRSDLVGSSPAMKQLARCIDKVVAYDLPVLISGESGTGKELAALAVHRHSRRAAGPFVAVNCGALPPSLIQSELFGHEKGAFTGAHQRKAGLLEQAAKGTLFLDEIGELPMELQANLLRVLQQKTLYRVGGKEEIPLDVRIISATHVDLEAAAGQGRFREDLFYRLNVLRIDMPPLRERGQDIELLAQHFLESFRKDHRCKARRFSKRALKAMRGHHWPGNVRELKNRIERALVMCDQTAIRPEDLDLLDRPPQYLLANLREAKDQAEKEALLKALAHTANNVLAAARILDVSYVTLYRLIKKHGIKIGPMDDDDGLHEPDRLCQLAGETETR
jgi:DNA-binding NtrC family response regulator